MNDERLATVRRAFEGLVSAMETGDEGSMFRAPWDPGVEYAEDERWPGAGQFKGAEAVARRFAEYGEVIGEVTAVLEDVRDAGDKAAVTVSITGRAGASGLPMDHIWTYLVTESDGRVTRLEAFLDPPDTRP